MKIAFFETEPFEEDYLTKNLKNKNMVFFKQKLNSKTAVKAKDCDAVCTFIYSKVDSKVLDQLPKVKLVATRSTGFDHIDLDECKKRKVRVANVPRYGENTVAEHAFALMLSLSRKIIEASDRVKTHNFDLKGLRGFDLKGRTLGILGCGSIGKHMARMAKGFEMNVLAYDLYQDKVAAKQIGYSYASLDEIYKKADVISVHMPYNSQTHHMINKDSIGKMKKGVIILNTARGAIIDTGALLKALHSGKVGAAGLDVLESEIATMHEDQLLKGGHSMDDFSTVIENDLLNHLPNVIITPHNAFNSNEAVERILDTTISNLKGVKPAYVV